MTTSALDTRSSEISRHLVQLLDLANRRESAVIDIIVWVARGIIDGRLAPEQDVNSVELAHRFHSSRTPVREALAVLESNQLIEMRARRRPRVASFSPQRGREVFFIRAQLMAALTRTAAERATEHDMARLETQVEQLRGLAAVRDDELYRWAHFRYFDEIVKISGNATARGILNPLFVRTLPHRQALSSPARLDESFQFVELIIAAIRRRDADMAALAMRRAIEAAGAAIAMGPGPTDSGPGGRGR